MTYCVDKMPSWSACKVAEHCGPSPGLTRGPVFHDMPCTKREHTHAHIREFTHSSWVVRIGVGEWESWGVGDWGSGNSSVGISFELNGLNGVQAARWRHDDDGDDDNDDDVR